MKKNNFYITTTLPYVNASPHIGFALEIIQADCLARFKKLQGDNVFFNTGTDEHGLKIYKQAKKQGKKPQAYVNKYAKKFDNLKKALNLSYNSFIRTTDSHHKKAAQKFWLKCLKNGDIYKAKQKIKYCIGCEMEKTESELKNNRCPLHPNKKIEVLKEENYFFKFSNYEKKLLNFYKKTENKDFVIPKNRFKEIKNFVKTGLKDFSISRLKEKMPWGIPVPNDSKHVMYVWFDALINYISCLGWPDNKKNFKNWWPGMQVAGKDNLRQQSAIWQAMLMSANLPNSKQILIHGFITSNGQKMSKSLGNVVNPFDIVKKYGTDSLRYYLLKEIPPVKDGDFTYKHFEEVYNADLANGLGNLVQRVAVLCQKAELKGSIKNNFYQNHKGKTSNFLTNFKFNQALIYIWKHIQKLDKEIDTIRPWQKKGRELEKFLKKITAEIVQIAGALKPFLPETSEKIEKVFTAKQIKAPKKPLFPRV
jgi:methionyl-tRNA synthetase